jgi:hypothetical protein
LAVEAFLLVWSGIVLDRLRFRSAPSLTLPRHKRVHARLRRAMRGREGRGQVGLTGFCISLFALVAYPLIGPLIGRPWLQIELFGVAPDPTVIATLGVLVAAHRPCCELLVIPLVWCAISGATLWTMQSPDALVMPVVAALTLVLAVWKR